MPSPKNPPFVIDRTLRVFQLNKKLEKCMAFINSSLLKHNIILGVDDRGKLSCQKVNLCFIYLESADCIKKLEQILDEKPPEDATQNGNKLFDREEYLKVKAGHSLGHFIRLTKLRYILLAAGLKDP